MKKEWSPKWVSSVQPRKQRKFRYNAPLHTRRKFVSVHLQKDLRERFETRAVPVRVGDDIRVMRGSFKGKTGTVEKVLLSSSKIYVTGIKVKKVDGSEVAVALQPSNLLITKLNTDDKMRVKMLERKRGTEVKTVAKEEKK